MVAGLKDRACFRLFWHWNSSGSICLARRGTSIELFVSEPDGQRNTYLQHAGQNQKGRVAVFSDQNSRARRAALSKTSSVIMPQAIRNGPYLKKVESKTHLQIAMLAGLWTILRRVESSVRHAALFWTIMSNFLPRLGEKDGYGLGSGSRLG
jgi:hypothetical protein